MRRRSSNYFKSESKDPRIFNTRTLTWCKVLIGNSPRLPVGIHGPRQAVSIQSEARGAKKSNALKIRSRHAIGGKSFEALKFKGLIHPRGLFQPRALSLGRSDEGIPFTQKAHHNIQPSCTKSSQLPNKGMRNRVWGFRSTSASIAVHHTRALTIRRRSSSDHRSRSGFSLPAANLKSQWLISLTGRQRKWGSRFFF